MSKSLVPLLFLLALSPSISRAELPPQAYEKAKQNAPEFIEIEITRVALASRDTERLKTTSVFAQATVKSVERSAAGLKPGDKISLRYLAHEALGVGWAGPASNFIVQKGGIYRAYLKKAGPHFYIAAWGRSFEVASQ